MDFSRCLVLVSFVSHRRWAWLYLRSLCCWLHHLWPRTAEGKMWCGVWCRSVMTKGYNYTAKAIFWIVLVFFFWFVWKCWCRSNWNWYPWKKKPSHSPDTIFFPSQSENLLPVFQNPLTSQGRFSPIQGRESRHLTTRQDPSTAGVLVDLGLAANALTLGAVPWTLRTVDPGVSDASKERRSEGCDPMGGEFF